MKILNKKVLAEEFKRGYKAAQKEALRTVRYHRMRAENWNDAYRPGGLMFAEDMRITIQAEIENEGPLTLALMNNKGNDDERV